MTGRPHADERTVQRRIADEHARPPQKVKSPVADLGADWNDPLGPRPQSRFEAGCVAEPAPFCVDDTTVFGRMLLAVAEGARASCGACGHVFGRGEEWEHGCPGRNGR